MIDKILLYPYYAFLKVRNGLYNSGKLKSSVCDVPTICIGGIAAGGTGKTPCTEYILSLLRSSSRWMGKEIAVLSRGYKRKSKGFMLVSADGSADMSGDEPLQMKKKFPDIKVAVCRNRVEGCERLDADIIVLDDAYQARELKARKNIVLTDYNRPLFEDKLLPLGTLRDLPERLYDADMVIVTKCPETMDPVQTQEYAARLGYRSYNPFTCEAVTPTGKGQYLFFAYIEYLPCEPIDETTDHRYVYAKSVIMLTGIAIDTPLARKLSDSYTIVKRFSLGDHHYFTRADMKKLSDAAALHPLAAIVTTEKDKQRLMNNEFIDRELFKRMFIAPIRMKIHGEEQSQIFEREILAVG